MASSFTPAPEVKELAIGIIHAHHEHLLANAVRIEYLFSDKIKKIRGKGALAYVSKISNLPAFLARDENEETGEIDDDAFFVMVVYEPAWRFQLTPAQRVALVDHELCHLYAEEDEQGLVKLSLLPHDLEEFNAVVRRHGAWAEDVQAILKAAAEGPQLPFEFTNTGTGKQATG